MRIPSAIRVLPPFTVALWMLMSASAWAVYNGIPPVNGVDPGSVQSVQVKLPDQPPQIAVDRETCEKTKKPDETCPPGFNWYVNFSQPLKTDAIADVTFTGAGKTVIADGQVSVNRFGRFGDWLRLDLYTGASGIGSLASDGTQTFSLPRYYDALEQNFTTNFNTTGSYWNDVTYFHPIGYHTGLQGSDTAINMRVPLIRQRQRCYHLTPREQISELIQRANLVPVTGFTIPAEDGGGMIIGGYVRPITSRYKFIDNYTVQVDEPKTATGTSTVPKTGTGTTPGGGQPQTDGQNGGDDGGGDDFGWARADWTEEVICRKELQNGGGGAQVNVRPTAPDPKDFVEGKNTPQWDPVKDGKEPLVGKPDDPQKLKKMAEEVAKDTQDGKVEIEISDDDCARTRTLVTVSLEQPRGEGIAAVTSECPYPSGKMKLVLVDEEVYSVFTFGTTDTYKDLSEIVARAQAMVAPHYDPTGQCGKCINDLEIWGHGDVGGGYISFGSEDAVIGDKNMGDGLDSKLAAIGGLMCTTGKVVINQCNGGKGDTGTRALQQLADKIGVPVSGPVGEIKACRVFGGAVTSYKEASPGANAKTPASNKAADVKAPEKAK